MSPFIEVGKMRAAVLEAIGHLLQFEKAAAAYATDPSFENGEELVQEYTKVASASDLLKLHLETMVKQANGVTDEVVGEESENGVRLG
jgi:hypothetical protein